MGVRRDLVGRPVQERQDKTRFSMPPIIESILVPTLPEAAPPLAALHDSTGGLTNATALSEGRQNGQRWSV